MTLTFVFFVSGAAGLIFEVVWFYRCGLVFGNSIWAASVVLSSFMGGLAFGNGLVGRYGFRIRHLLRAYATLEAVVAVAGVSLTYALPELTRLLAPLTGPFAENLWLVNLIRLVTAFTVLCVPATAMGATLPVLLGALCRNQGLGFGRALGRLYGWNTLGAVLGVVGAEVVLIDRVGVTGTAWFAALLNLGAASAALQLSRRADRTESVPTISVSGPLTPPSSAWRPLACAFLAGADLLALEVVWFRFLSMYAITTTLVISLVLAVVLAGIGTGGLSASSWLKRRRPRVVMYLPAVAFTAGAALVVSYGGFQPLTEGTQVVRWSRILWFACVLTFPTSFLSGVMFTLIGEALGREIAIETSAAGWLTLANTAGAMAGPPLAAFVLLPGLGMERSFFMLAMTYGAIGLLSMRTLGRGVTSARSVASWLAATALLIALAGFPFGRMTSAYFPRAATAYANDGSEIVATREGPTETIFVMQQKWMGQPIYSRLVTNGFSMSGTTTSGQRYMRYFVYWPMLLHRTPLRRVLIVCYGAGVTVGAAVDVPSVESIDVVEISRDIVATSDVIYAADQHPLHDRRVRLHLEDGRYFLQTTGDRFDLITGEPPPPRLPGAVNIYTREYFQLIYDRLAEGGITTYWLPVARPDPGTDVNTIVRAFCDVFEDCSLWNGTPSDLMLVGTRHAVGPISAADFAVAWDTPVLQSRLREVGFEMPQQIGATFIGDAMFLRSLTANTPPLTDDFPQRLRPVPTRPSLSDPRFPSDPVVADLYQHVVDPARAREAFGSSDFIRRLWPESLIQESLPFFAYQSVMNRVLWEGGQPLRQIEDLHLLLTKTSLRTLPLWVLGSDGVRQRIADTRDDGTMSVQYAQGVRALVRHDYLGAVPYFAKSDRPLLVYALCLGGELDGARRLARIIEPGDADELHFWRWLESTFSVSAPGLH